MHPMMLGGAAGTGAAFVAQAWEKVDGMGVWIVIFTVTAWAGILSVRLWRYRKQMQELERQLEFLKQTGSNIRLVSACPIGRTGQLISSMNQLLGKLREEKRELELKNRSYRESITSISHDIRTPLTSAKGYAKMLQNPKIPEGKREEYLKIIGRRLDDLTGMLNQLFEYARLEAGEWEWEQERVNVGNLFAETISMFYGDFLAKGCEPQVELPETPCILFVDAHGFVRILENLIKNALVHGTGGYVCSLASEGTQAILKVSNETDDMEEKDMGLIFERFYTTDQSRSRKGTGLGLAIAREFTEQMGGQIEARLTGRRFTVEVRFGLAVTLQPDTICPISKMGW